MLIEESTLRSLLRLAESAMVECEEEPGPSRAERIIVRGPEGGEDAYIVRRDADGERAMNHAAVVEALANAGFAAMPRVVAIAGDATIEEAFPGLPLLSIRPDQSTLEAAVDALAALHQLPVSEGSDFEKTPEELLPEEEPPLHRLGFAAQEREPALEPFRSAHRSLLKTPFGFAHRNLTAANVLAGAPGVAFVNFGHAGFGAQLFDVVALLSTAGLSPEQRRSLAQRYALRTGGDPDAVADLADLAAIAWGVERELGLPRRQIEALGDEVAMERLVLESTRIQQALAEPAGEHPLATQIRRALWPR